MNVFYLAWRNIWRNKRRTLITISAVLFAVLLSTVMSSMQEGTYIKMIDNIVKFYSGYIQIHHPDYWENKTINNVFLPQDSLFQKIEEVPEINMIVPRLESFSLVSYEENTRGGLVIGIDPKKEDKLSNLSRWIHEGKYLTPEDDGVLVSINMANNLGIEINDTLVLLSQGYHGMTAAGLFPVKGIVKFASPMLNNLGIYMGLSAAQNFYGVNNMITSWVLMVPEYTKVNSAYKKVNEIIRKNLKAMTWDQMQPEVVQLIESDRAGGVVMKAILYMVIAFIMFGTIIMMVAERKRENGVMVAIGMQKKKLARVMFMESITLGMLGLIIGFIISIPLIIFMRHNPIPIPSEYGEAYAQFGLEPVLYFGTMPKVFINQLITVFIITLIICLYPVFQSLRLNIIHALRNE